ncbi:MAG: glycosyltransferase family 9 protein [Lysobacteraceae bacterium]
MNGRPSPPRSLCLLRLSALGDVSHAVPVLRALQQQWPQTALTWIIGRFEHRLVGDLPGVEFIVFDKKQGWRGHAALRRQLAGRRFDALLHMQVAMRANLVSAWVGADRRIGYDRARSKDLHGLFIGERIAERHGQHVLDAFFSFLEPLGLEIPAVPRWDIPVPDAAHAFARAALPGEQPTLLLSPCSSHPLRNWRAERYAAVADHAVRRHGWRVLLCGGPSELERRMGDAILAAARVPIIDLIGRDTIKQLQALLTRASAVLSPDSGPLHMANAAGTPVIALHAASNPARSGPYSERRYVIDRYDAAARKFLGRPAEELPWGKKVEVDGAMDLIEVDAVTAALDRLVADRGGRGHSP